MNTNQEKVETQEHKGIIDEQQVNQFKEVEGLKENEEQKVTLNAFPVQKGNQKKLLEELNQFISQGKDIENSKIEPQEKQILKQDFQIIQTIEQKELCYAISFNSDINIMIAACGEFIKAYDFIDGQLKEKQKLEKHTNYITALQFMNKSNQFVSASFAAMKLWGMNDNQQFELLQQFQKDGHMNQIYCLIINKADDLIISGCNDQTTKFWMKKDKWECIQTMTVHSRNVFSLSLNESQNKLVSCGYDNTMIIYQVKENKQWTVIQRLSSLEYGCKLCFIDDEIFTFQPSSGHSMFVFEQNPETQQFSKTATVQLENSGGDCVYFPSVFNKNKQVLMHRFGSIIYLMRRKNKKEFEIEQKIQFGSNNVYGAITADWEYLVTWNYHNKQIEIRKQQK